MQIAIRSTDQSCVGVDRMPSLAFLYLEAKSRVVESGFGNEIRWQAQVSPDGIDERTFLREAAWVILSSGMRESVIRDKFPAFSKAFCDWKCAMAIYRQRSICADRAMSVFGHQGKIAAILALAEHVYRNGFEAVERRLKAEGPEFLQRFPYLGPATSMHLAKNLGLDVVKPDRHLIRASRAARFESPSAFCAAIAEEIGDRVAVIDIVVWRFATIERRYEAHFGQCS